MPLQSKNKKKSNVITYEEDKLCFAKIFHYTIHFFFFFIPNKNTKYYILYK